MHLHPPSACMSLHSKLDMPNICVVCDTDLDDHATFPLRLSREALGFYIFGLDGLFSFCSKKFRDTLCQKDKINRPKGKSTINKV